MRQQRIIKQEGIALQLLCRSHEAGGGSGIPHKTRAKLDTRNHTLSPPLAY